MKRPVVTVAASQNLVYCVYNALCKQDRAEGKAQCGSLGTSATSVDDDGY